MAFPFKSFANDTFRQKKTIYSIVSFDITWNQYEQKDIFGMISSSTGSTLQLNTFIYILQNSMTVGTNRIWNEFLFSVSPGCSPSHENRSAQSTWVHSHHESNRM